MRARHHLRRTAPIALLASMTLISTPGVSFAAPDAQTAQPRNAQVSQIATKADKASLDEQIATAQKALKKAQGKEATAKEDLDAARKKHEEAGKKTASARKRAEQAGVKVDKATTHLKNAREQVDEFASASYRQGSMIGSIIGYLGSDSPVDVLAKSALLNMIGDSHLDVADGLREAVAEEQSAEKKAQAALEKAEAEERKAAEAEEQAKKAHESAVKERNEAKAKVDDLVKEKKAREAERAAKKKAQAPAGGAAAQQAAPAPAPSVVKPAEGTFTSGYGARWGSTHYGVDIANDIGTPIYSAMSGTVISSGPASGFGLWVRVQHDNGLITVYGHIHESLVSIGQRVEAGQQIATIGNRGQSTGPHLHFEVWKNGDKIDPLPFLNAHGISL